jgi:hypothetical protein
MPEMLNKLKNLDKEQKDGELKNIQLNKNQKSSPKEDKEIEEITIKELSPPEEDKLATLESLKEEWETLLAEKKQLQNMAETLKQKIEDEIEIKRYNIENLKSEITELKQKCEKLAKALDITVQK